MKCNDQCTGIGHIREGHKGTLISFNYLVSVFFVCYYCQSFRDFVDCFFHGLVESTRIREGVAALSKAIQSGNPTKFIQMLVPKLRLCPPFQSEGECYDPLLCSDYCCDKQAGTVGQVETM